MLLVDDVHNINSQLTEFSKRFESGLFVSATVPEDLNDQLNTTAAFHYTFAQAIKDNMICDYRIVIPDIIQETDNCWPTDLSWPVSVDKEQYYSLATKAQFLVTGMILHGNRRCIAYMKSKAECEPFLKYVKQLCEEYQGYKCWTGVIIEGVNRTNRTRLREESSDKESNRFNIVATVRILDEAIDIPSCDSLFITSIGDKFSTVRTVQRVSRANRIDTDRPEKKSSIFLWVDDMNDAIYPLTLLKTSDPQFVSKIICQPIDYDSSGTSSVRERVAAKTTASQDFVSVNCTAPEEMWERKRQSWSLITRELKHQPSQSAEKGSDESNAATWASTQRNAYKKGKMSNERIEELTVTAGWSWEVDYFNDGLSNWKKECEQPSHSAEKGSLEKKAAGRATTQRRAYRRGKMSIERIEAPNTTSGWTWEIDSFNDALIHWKKECARLGDQQPSHGAEKGSDEKKAAMWLTRQRSAHKEGRMSHKHIEVLNSMAGWTWEVDYFNDGLGNWKKEYAKLRYQKPSQGVKKGSDEKRAAKWAYDQRSAYRSGEISN
jgi:superfamily II DNA or RNA helicase